MFTLNSQLPRPISSKQVLTWDLTLRRSVTPQRPGV